MNTPEDKNTPTIESTDNDNKLNGTQNWLISNEEYEMELSQPVVRIDKNSYDEDMKLRTNMIHTSDKREKNGESIINEIESATKGANFSSQPETHVSI